jgi:uncharacterized membrane protein YeaQ/YmgE (transglycosylase-associated protein family)
VGTLLVGSLGSVIGPLLLSLFLDRKIANPINPFGLVAAVGGAVLLLAGYRLLIKWLTAGPQPEPEEA